MPSRGYYPNGLPEAVIHWVEAIKKGSECKCNQMTDSVFYCEDEEMYVAGILYAVLDRPIQGSDPPHIFIDVEKNMEATTRDTRSKHYDGIVFNNACNKELNQLIPIYLITRRFK